MLRIARLARAQGIALQTRPVSSLNVYGMHRWNTNLAQNMTPEQSSQTVTTEESTLTMAGSTPLLSPDTPATLEPAPNGIKSTSKSKTTRPPKRTPNARFSIHTLDPSKLLASDFLDLTTTSGAVRIEMPNSSYNYVEFAFRVPAVNGIKGKPKAISFPRGSRGFLYFTVPPGEPATAGELRFRRTTSAEPESFAAGEDLKVGDKTWRIAFKRIFHGKNVGLKELILADGLGATKEWATYEKENKDQIYTPESRNKRKRSIHTLSPSNLLPSDYLDLSGLSTATINALDGQVRLTYFNRRFPENTCGFLYYHTSPGRASLGGEIRFRLTESNDPDTFVNGHDLEENHVPWHMTLASILLHEHANGFHRLVASESHVAPALLDKYRGMLLAEAVTRGALVPPTGHQAEYLHALDQPFFVRFEYPIRSLFAVGKDEIKRVSAHDIDAFVDVQRPVADSGKRHRPWNGSGYCRLEQSSGNIVVMRVVKILSPPVLIEQYDGHLPMPQEGELVRQNDGEPWSVEVDDKSAIQLLLHSASPDANLR